MNFSTWLPILGIFSVALLLQCQTKELPDKTISAEEVYEIINDSLRVNTFAVLDTRERMDYIRGHLVSAFWLTADSIEHKMEIIVKEKRPLIIYDADGSILNSCITRMLAANGIKNFTVMKGGFSEWIKQGYPAAIQLVRNTSDTIHIQRKEISATQTRDVLHGDDPLYVLVDIRSYPVFQEGHIKGAISIPYVPINDFVVQIEALNFPRNKPIILYDDMYANVSEKAAEVMVRNDFTQVFILKGGIEEWTMKNYPMEYGSISAD